MATRRFSFKILFFVTLALVSFIGSAANLLHLFQQTYLWPVVRLVGYGSLLVYSLLMLRRARYNTRL